MNIPTKTQLTRHGLTLFRDGGKSAMRAAGLVLHVHEARRGYLRFSLNLIDHDHKPIAVYGPGECKEGDDLFLMRLDQMLKFILR